VALLRGSNAGVPAKRAPTRILERNGTRRGRILRLKRHPPPRSRREVCLRATRRAPRFTVIVTRP